MENKVDKGLVTVFTDVLDERLRGKRLTLLERRQPILRKRIIKIFDDCSIRVYPSSDICRDAKAYCCSHRQKVAL
jgi:hypothetical protein